MDDADVLVYLGFVVWGVAVLLESLSGLDMMTIAAGNFHAAVIVDPQPHDIAVCNLSSAFLCVCVFCGGKGGACDCCAFFLVRVARESGVGCSCITTSYHASPVSPLLSPPFLLSILFILILIPFLSSSRFTLSTLPTFSTRLHHAILPEHLLFHSPSA